MGGSSSDSNDTLPISPRTPDAQSVATRMAMPKSGSFTTLAAASNPSGLSGVSAPGSPSRPPLIRYGEAHQVKKGEDFWLIKTDVSRVLLDGTPQFHVFGVFDGHNGKEAAVFVTETLLQNILSIIPDGLHHDEWLGVLPQAMVAGFVKTDKEFQDKGIISGTTATLVIVDEWTVTTACVGDSRAILDTQGSKVVALTEDHRLEGNREEVLRIKESGGEVARLVTIDGDEVGPLRVWPGGLCLSRSIGDFDVGHFVVPVPHVRQVRLPTAGGRIIMASDGVWDAVDSSKAARSCRGMTPEAAAVQVVKESIKARGLRDDTTCIVVDITPAANGTTPAVIKKPGRLNRMFGRLALNADHSKHGDGEGMAELYDARSAKLADRLGPEMSIHAGSSMVMCALCKVDLAPGGVSVHAGNFFSSDALHPGKGPYLCRSCKEKQDDMEGLRRAPLERVVEDGSSSAPPAGA